LEQLVLEQSTFVALFIFEVKIEDFDLVNPPECPNSHEQELKTVAVNTSSMQVVWGRDSSLYG
jgi:hypothetical protein